MSIELASFPNTQTSQIAAFVKGANAVIRHAPADCASPTPLTIELEFRKSGNVHIWLHVGRWTENGEVAFPTVADLRHP